ncbi:unnamed protein product, partial [Ectocarpus sp. 12 AP-2014]
MLAVAGIGLDSLEFRRTSHSPGLRQGIFRPTLKTKRMSGSPSLGWANVLVAEAAPRLGFPINLVGKKNFSPRRITRLAEVWSSQQCRPSTLRLRQNLRRQNE